jgi:hypothetical protein
MHALSAAELLDVWEQGQARTPVDRALLLLAAACPELQAEDLAGFPIGQRDARLLRLREWTFGPPVVSLATCPQCGERLELSFQVGDVLTPSPEPGGQPSSLSVGPYDVQFRLPNSRDLAVATGSGDVEDGRRLLVERCVLAARRGDDDEPAGDLPAEVVAVLAEQMAQGDPQGDVRLALACPACGHEWQAAFDIVSFFWSEIHAWAQRILREVHALASAYGWREADILAMSPWRRQAYLELVGPG